MIHEEDEETLDLTQQEIFQNMTNGEWKDVGNRMVHAFTHDDRVECVAEFEYVTDLRAAIAAVNNTYGKGINPESVEKMYNTLAAIKSSFWMEGEAAEERVQDLKQMAQEALTAAKL